MSELTIDTGEMKPASVRRARGGDLIIRTDGKGGEHREFAPGSIWAQLSREDPLKKKLFFVVTTGPARDRGSRGERKIERDLPSGRRIRIFREGASFGVENRREKKMEPTDHILQLEIGDALHIAMYMENVHIEHRRERIDLDEIEAKEKKKRGREAAHGNADEHRRHLGNACRSRGR